MRIDNALLRAKFKEYNRLYFNKKLITPQFSTYYSSGGALGLCFPHKEKSMMRISMARNVDWTEESLKSVLVHEMIHLYLFQIGRRWAGCHHGRPFFRVADEIRKVDGLVITKRYPGIKFLEPKNNKKPRTLSDKCTELFKKLFRNNNQFR